MAVFSHSISVVVPSRDIDGLQLLIHHVAFIVQLPTGSSAHWRVLDVDIAPVIADVLADGVLIAVIHQEMSRHRCPHGWSASTLWIRMPLKALLSPSEGDGLAVLHLEIVRCGIV